MSGHVAAVGPGVTTLRAGQPVFIAGYEIGNRGGLYAEYAAVPEQAAWPLPSGVDADEATALTNYQLAWILLHHAARGVSPKTVVVYGAAGGVGVLTGRVIVPTDRTVVFSPFGLGVLDLAVEVFLRPGGVRRRPARGRQLLP